MQSPMRARASAWITCFVCLCLFVTLQRAYVITDCPIRPENWKQLFGRHRCRRSCLLDADCAARHQCICDQECGLSCVKRDTVCPIPETKLENGRVRYPQLATVGSSIQYDCSSGHRLVGPSIRVCQGNRQWSGHQPACSTYDKCAKPPDLPFAVHNASKEQLLFRLNTVLRYDCTDGYHADEGSYVLTKCLSHKGKAEWFGPDIKCTARSCGHPGEVLNAVRIGEAFTFPNTVMYRCIDGFLMIGSPHLQCTARGQWEGEKPSCKPVNCEKPKSPLYGHVQGTSLDFQSKVVYSCDEGYRLVGQKQRICQSDGTWSGLEPYCEEVSCQTLGVLWNGFIDGDEGTTFGSMVIFRCLEGMTHLGSPYSRCQKDGTWSHPLPSCMAPCQMPRVSNGQILRDNGDEPVPHGERIHVQCVPFHELEFSESPVCKNGSWSHLPRCVPIRCKKWPEPIRNGYVQFTKTHHGALAKFHCRPGFLLKGSATSRCSFGEWKGSRPICVEQYCPHPKTVVGDIENGSIKLEGSMGSYEYKDFIQNVGEHRTIVFECHHGYLLEGPSKATCVNGTWQPNIQPRCVLQSHPAMPAGLVNWNVPARQKRHLTWEAAHSIWRSKLTKQRKEHQRNLWHDEADISNRLFLRHRQRSSGQMPADGPSRASISDTAARGCTVPANGKSFFVFNYDIVRYGYRVQNGSVVSMHCSPNHTIDGPNKSQCVQGRWTPSFGRCIMAPSADQLERISEVDSSCLPPADAGQAAVIWLPSMEMLENDNPATISKNGLRRYPNATIVKYACQPAQQTGKQQAMSVQCINGRWIALLRPCFLPLSSRKTSSAHGSTASRRHNAQSLSSLSLPSPARQSLRCPKPEVPSPWRVSYLSRTKNGRQKSLFKATYRHGATVTVVCTRNNMAIKIKCVSGRWTQLDHSLCKNTSNDQPVVSPGDCLFNPEDFAHMRVMNENTGEGVIFTQFLREGTVLLLRCEHLGMFQLVGPAKTLCRNGTWYSGSAKPYCRPVGATKSGHPPAIIYRVVHGDVAPSPFGELVVRRSSTVQLDCLFPKHMGKPHWRYTSSYRQYPHQWVNVSVDPDRFKEAHIVREGTYDSVSAYRLTIYMARPEDSGTYYCVDPIGRRHAIRLLVKDITCPPLITGKAMVVKTTKGNYFGSVADLKCQMGFYLSGGNRIRCLVNARWSQWPLPECIAVQCPPINNVDLALTINVSSYQYGGVAVFQCKPGFALDGPRYVQCTSSGRWSEDAPTCAVVRCAIPDVPTGSVVVPRKGIYYYRDIVLFSCSPGYLLTGKNYAICNQHGLWTNPAPECLRYCWFPGKPPFGDTTSEPKSYYLAGDLIVYYCVSGRYVLQGSAVLRCTSAGKWSASVPSCVAQSPKSHA